MHKKPSILRTHLSRLEIEEEIRLMVKNILDLIDDDKNDKTLFVVDGYCHLDILFDK
jgi:hypothetical protein